MASMAQMHLRAGLASRSPSPALKSNVGKKVTFEDKARKDLMAAYKTATAHETPDSDIHEFSAALMEIIHPSVAVLEPRVTSQNTELYLLSQLVETKEKIAGNAAADMEGALQVFRVQHPEMAVRHTPLWGLAEHAASIQSFTCRHVSSTGTCVVSGMNLDTKPTMRFEIKLRDTASPLIVYAEKGYAADCARAYLSLRTWPDYVRRVLREALERFEGTLNDIPQPSVRLANFLSRHYDWITALSKERQSAIHLLQSIQETLSAFPNAEPARIRDLGKTSASEQPHGKRPHEDHETDPPPKRHKHH